MTEQVMRQRVVRLLKPLHAISFENLVYPGTPDVNYIEGWLELKYLHKWPKGYATIVRIATFTQQQRVWLLKRWMKGGQVHLLLQVAQEWLLFEGKVAAKIVGRCVESCLRGAAVAVWPTRELDKELLACLSMRRN